MDQETIIAEPKKASFGESVGSGIKGYLKGLFAGGAVGAAGGALIGATIAIATGGASIGLAALAGAAYGFSILGAAGSLAGAMTGVVQSREKNQVHAQDIIKVATLSYAQGVGVGQNLAQAQAAEKSGTHFQDKLKQERGAQDTGQQLH